MRFDPLPEHVAPFKLCSQHAVVKGTVPLSKFERLGEYLSSRQGEALAVLTFSQDSQNRCLIAGQVTATLVLQCQRCLEDTSVAIESGLAVIVTDESDSPEPDEELDAVEVKEGRLDLLALVEDELILSLPIVAYHERPDCNEALRDLRRAGREAGEGGSENPFAALQALKGNLKK